MKSKKYLFVVLSLIMSLSLLAGCTESGQKDTDDLQQTQSAGTPANTGAPTGAPTKAPTKTPTETPTSAPTQEPEPSEAPGMHAVITVADSKDNWNVFGSSVFADLDVGISKPLVKVQHIPDPTEETQYDSYVSLTFDSDKACKADVVLEIICPDAVAGASGYVLEYFVNSYNDDAAFDYIELNYEAEATLNELQTFEITVDLREGENTLYFVQRTPNNAGGWRIDITSATVIPYGDAVISGYTEPAEE